MFVNIFKIMESDNDNYIYIYIVTHQQNIYSRKMKIQLYQFYFKKVEINNCRKVKIDGTYISPFEYII